jgi:hypothetical protein
MATGRNSQSSSTDGRRTGGGTPGPSYAASTQGSAQPSDHRPRSPPSTARALPVRRTPGWAVVLSVFQAPRVASLPRRSLGRLPLFFQAMRPSDELTVFATRKSRLTTPTPACCVATGGKHFAIVDQERLTPASRKSEARFMLVITNREGGAVLAVFLPAYSTRSLTTLGSAGPLCWWTSNACVQFGHGEVRS